MAGGGGNIKRTLMAGLGLAGGELVGDLVARGALKVGVGKLFDVAKVPTNFRAPLLRVAVGLFAPRFLRMLKLPGAVMANFGAVNVASGVLALTAGMRQQALSKVGLGDYELADVLIGDDGDDVYEIGDYELADYELAGDYSDQDYYLNYEASS